MAVSNSMRRVWLGLSLSIALLCLYPAWIGLTGWLWFGVSSFVFVVFLLEPWFLTWELRKRGEALQITDEGVFRRLARGDSEYVRWSDLREVSLVMTQGVNLSEEFFYVLAGTGTSGVLVGQALATKYDLLAHLAKLPGFNHGNVTAAMASPVNQRFTLWRAAPIEGEAVVMPHRLLN
jgi:hypothetical protein